MESSNYSSSNHTNSKHRSKSDKQSKSENTSLSLSEKNSLRGQNFEINIRQVLNIFEKTSSAMEKNTYNIKEIYAIKFGF